MRIESTSKMSNINPPRQPGDQLSPSKDVKKRLSFGIEAILGPTKHSSDNPQQLKTNKITSEPLVKHEVKEEPKDEELSQHDQQEEEVFQSHQQPVNFPFSYSHYFPLTPSSSSLSSSSSSWSDERRSGSTSPPLQELRRPFLPSSSSSSTSLLSSSSSPSSLMMSEEEKLTRPMLPFLLPHSLSLRRHRIDRSVEIQGGSSYNRACW